MAGSSSPCGACKFLRRKCVKGCIFAPYFCHEQGANHFSAIHKVFGASNVSKLLAHLPVSDRCEAAVTISYEAQARLQDPIYGCVSHIFALQQQVVSLQAQLASMKEQAAHQSFTSSGSSAFANPNGKLPNYSQAPLQDVYSWFDLENKETVPQFNSTYNGNGVTTNPNSTGININYENSVKIPDENVSYGSSSFDEEVSCFDMQMNNKQWSFQDADDELQSMAFSYINQHS